MSAGSRFRGRPLIPRYEAALIDGAAATLWVMALARLAGGYLHDRMFWLLDSQIAAILLLSALLRLAGLYLPRSLSFVTQLIGVIAWISALSLAPRFGWPREPLPDWQPLACGALLLLTLVISAVLRQRSLKRLRGHGFEWMLDWAWEKPYYTRLATVRMLCTLGYRNTGADED